MVADRYEDALAAVAASGSASTSRLQRDLGIGYNEAARYIERMEAEGRCSAPNVVGKRVLAPQSQPGDAPPRPPPPPAPAFNPVLAALKAGTVASYDAVNLRVHGHIWPKAEDHIAFDKFLKDHAAGVAAFLEALPKGSRADCYPLRMSALQLAAEIRLAAGILAPAPNQTR